MTAPWRICCHSLAQSQPGKDDSAPLVTTWHSIAYWCIFCFCSSWGFQSPAQLHEESHNLINHCAHWQLDRPQVCCACSGKPKPKQKKKRSKKKNSMLQAVDSEDVQEAEARPSSDPLPASSVDPQKAGQPSNSCWSATPRLGSTFDHTNDTCVAESHLEQPASLRSEQQPFSKRLFDGSEGLSTSQDKAHGHEVSQPAEAQELQAAKLDQMSVTSEGASEGWRQPNGHAPQQCSSNRSASMDTDDVALLADMQGFASALGCDWQVQLQTADHTGLRDIRMPKSLMPAFACECVQPVTKHDQAMSMLTQAGHICLACCACACTCQYD